MKTLAMIFAGWMILAATALAQMEMPKPGTGTQEARHICR
jgi:hypothetical protein